MDGKKEKGMSGAEEEGRGGARKGRGKKNLYNITPIIHGKRKEEVYKPPDPGFPFLKEERDKKGAQQSRRI